MLTPLSALASEQAAPTERTMQKCLQFLDYAASQEEAILTYRASDMKLAIHSDASYLSKPKARSRAGGHMFMAGSDKIPINNGAVLNISQIIKAVMSSAAEAEIGALFINAKTAVSMRCTLEELGHSQPRTPIQTDNSTAHALLTNKILPKALKAMDMRFHWLRCRGAQDQYRFYWRPGTQNLADYWTKHHPASHHKSFRPQILTSAEDPNYTKLTTPKIQNNKSFVKHVLQTPLFAKQLGNTILVKLELWESVMVIINFGLPLTYAYATLRQSVTGNSTFRGIVFCNLGTPKTVISNFVASLQIETPYLSPYGYPNNVPVGQKNSSRQKTTSTQMY
jgi:hypothetical protein